MKKIHQILIVSFIAIALFSCSKDYIIGGKKNETNKVDQTTFDFLKSFEITTNTAILLERAGMVDEVNGDVTVFAPSNYAINRYLQRKNNRALRLDPNRVAMTVSSIPVEDLKGLGVYIVDKKYWSENIPKEGLILPTHRAGDSLRLTLDESNAEPGAAWDGSGQPGQGYQYSNFMQSRPLKVSVHFKRGNNWELSPAQRVSMGYDNPECDQVYKMYISDVLTKTGAVHVIYSGDYSYSDHYYYHTLFFFGTRADDLF
jgi:hypothetical protein